MSKFSSSVYSIIAQKTDGLFCFVLKKFRITCLAFFCCCVECTHFLISIVINVDTLNIDIDSNAYVQFVIKSNKQKAADVQFIRVLIWHCQNRVLYNVSFVSCALNNIIQSVLFEIFLKYLILFYYWCCFCFCICICLFRFVLFPFHLKA